MHGAFVKRAVEQINRDPEVLGLAVGGSWITHEIDVYSDVDLVLVTAKSVADDVSEMMRFANLFGKLLNAFTGEHVGEKRLLICLYDDPLLHVDIKFVTLEEFKYRVEDPVILWERDGALKQVILETTPHWPFPGYQWFEDRFWTWVHYVALKIGRGELFEALDGISFLRVTVIAPLLQIKNGQLPRGVRRVEQNFPGEDVELLKKTIPTYSVASIAKSIETTIEIYQNLRQNLYPHNIILHKETEKKCLQYLQKQTLPPNSQHITHNS